MCTITGTCNLKEFTGYKVALKINGKYYSPVTGMEYTLGKIKPPKRIRKNFIVEGWFVNVLQKKEHAHKKEMVGNTAVFINKKDAKNFRKDLKFWGLGFPGDDINLVILKMTLQNIVFDGMYGFDKVRIGSTIKSMKECP